jgi:Rha family phage regulatory protein
MNTQVQAVPAVDFNSFIFAQGEELKTNSLKIAEAFEKRHADVLRSIEKITSQVTDSFRERNFALTQIDTIMPTGGVRKDNIYELTKDGFVMVVMSFTGEKAMQVKEAYINAFNFMMGALRNKSPYGLVELESVNKTQWGILSAMVSDISIASGKEGTTKAALWSRFSNHFKIGGYKELPAIKFDDAVSYLGEKREQYDKGFTLAVVKKDDLLALGYDTDTKMFAVQALPTPKPKHTNGRTSVQQQMPNIRVDISMDDVENLVKEYGGMILYRDDVEKLKGVLKA